jgi:hypothetical protein
MIGDRRTERYDARRSAICGAWAFAGSDLELLNTLRASSTQTSELLVE